MERFTDNGCSDNIFNSGKVDCGGHTATSCSKCPCTKSGDSKGEAWCHDDCHWVDNECTEKPGKDIQVLLTSFLTLCHHGFYPPGDSGCFDDKESCGDWAEIGYCDHTYVDYMRVHCSESCDLCRK